MTEATFPSTPLGLAQVQSIVQAMVAVANSDGGHATELVLIREFYESCRQDAQGLSDFSDIVGRPFDAERAKEALSTPESQEALLMSCYFVAFADGVFSGPERAAIDKIVRAVGIAPGFAAQVLDHVRDRLVGQFAHSSQVGTLRAISKEMEG